MADLFAGIFVFSVERYDQYHAWETQQGRNRDVIVECVELSARDRERYVTLLPQRSYLIILSE